jgi:hypothetical protein
VGLAAEVPAPPTFPSDAPCTSKQLNSSAGVLDGPIAEYSVQWIDEIQSVIKQEFE